MEHLLTFHTESEDVSQFQPYVLDVAAFDALEGGMHALVFVVMKRERGALLVMPPDALSEDALSLGELAGPDDLIGPSLSVEVAAALFQPDFPNIAPVSVEGQRVQVLLVDFGPEILGHLQPMVPGSDLSVLSIQQSPR